MNQQTELTPATAACSQGADTGPGAQASTHLGFDPAQHPDSTAVLMFSISHGEIVVTAILTMGAVRKVEQRWRRRSPSSWVLAGGPPVFDYEKGAISPDLADFLDRAGVPIGIANMLPRQPSAAAAAAIAAAAQEVDRV
ncbi:hypothetical protein [Stenotrophomonas rhizophila]|uniref:hypothetical protein n=1 Tax=Stenotrophomonas rhizophila TaxID=216778 RepID=UPI001E393CD8|nr:hypothetical protein [Stenotrophomonas rhizophila]MCC7632555.1 hypothetical protein [Stenotrophomonas rhizophila]MCC7663407.1 hypothetical protein [Stenotrophomonas rhizophila]